MEIQIFAEGQDLKFIQDYIKFLNLPVTKLHSVKTEGWTNLPLVKRKFEEATDKGVKNLVIFDGNGNYTDRRVELTQIAGKLGINFELFLFPNNASNGIVEDLLITTIPHENHPFINCFHQYCDSVRQINPKVIFSPKSAFFAYIEATGQPQKMEKVNFADPIFWDLKSATLDNLKVFLQQHINVQT